MTNILGQRKTTYSRIGVAPDVQIKVGSSLDATVRVGRARKIVRGSIQKFEGELAEVTQEVEAYEYAPNYLEQVRQGQEQLAQIAELVADGDLTQADLKLSQQQYTDLLAQSQNNPALKRAITTIQQEAQTTTQQGSFTPPERRKLIMQPNPDLGANASDPEMFSIEFTNGPRPNQTIIQVQVADTIETIKVGNRIAEYVRLLHEASDKGLTDGITSTELAEKMNVSNSHLRAIATAARTAFAQSPLKPSSFSPHADRFKGIQGRHRLVVQTPGEADEA